MKRHYLLIAVTVCLAVLAALSGCIAVNTPSTPGSSSGTPPSTKVQQTPAATPSPTPTPTPTPSSSLPVINYFTATPSTVTTGSYTSLSWSTSNATSATITPGIGPASLSGRIPEAPSQTMTFTLTATGPGGSASSTTTVTVSDHPLPSR
ncbi:MAG: hypothetical protein WB588_07290 [Dehalococcoidia bacterium]